MAGLHRQVLESHRTGNVDQWLAIEADEYASANGGAITFPTTAERRAVREPHLQSMTFDSYRDLTDPIVQVSPDGQLGWVVAQVEIKGIRTSPDSTTSPVDDVWAWIELYRRIDGQWKLVGNVSNRQN